MTLRAQPFEAEHRSSVARQMAQPKGLGPLLAWFLREWSAEVPTSVHMRGVWHDHVGLTEDRRSVGGSLIGSPALASDFRRYIENSPSEIDQDGWYARPVHRALASMTGRNANSVFMARFLFALARAAGDVDAAAQSFGIPPEVAPVYAEAAMFRLWRAWEPAAR